MSREEIEKTNLAIAKLRDEVEPYITGSKHFRLRVVEGRRILARLTALLAENERLREALGFYADSRRYHGPNQAPIPNDPYLPQTATWGDVYIHDVTRDGGDIARAALNKDHDQ